MKEIFLAFENLYNSTNIPICIVENGSVKISFPSYEEPIFTKRFIEICIADFNYQADTEEQALLFTLSPSYLLGITKISNEIFLILGPAPFHEHSWSDLMKYTTSALYKDNHLAISRLLMSLPTTSIVAFSNTFSVAIYLYIRKNINIKEIRLSTCIKLESNIRPNLMQYILDARDGATFHTPQSYENQLTKAVMDGNISLLEELLNAPILGKLGKLGVLSTNSERQIRYMFITTSAVFARAAISGGLNYETACSIADIYCQTMDNESDFNNIKILRRQMMLDFCKEVANFKNKAHSYLAQECCDYIHKHAHDKINLNDLSIVCKLSPRRLSKKFFEEMNITIVDYIHQVKLEEAKLLLQYSNHSISDISNYLGYSNQSYFTAVFKQFYKITPNEFRIQKEN